MVQPAYSKGAEPFIRATLPITTSDGLALDAAKALAHGQQLATTYASADPYPHIVMDDFLPHALATTILENFPAAAEKNAAEYALNYPGIQVNKRQVYPYDCHSYCHPFCFVPYAR